MENNVPWQRKEQMDKSVTYASIPIKRCITATFLLPILAMAYSVISAGLFRHDEVNDGGCENITHALPSVSGVAGIKPQAYTIRVSYGLCSSPMILLSIMYYNFYTARLTRVKNKGLVRILANLCFWLHCTESLSLLLIGCVSTREDYPLHEKAVFTFLATGLSNMALHTILFKLARPGPMTQLETKSYFCKKLMLATTVLSAGVMAIGFYLHKTLCMPGAFSTFSASEYLFIISITGYHLTFVWDFSAHVTIATNCFDAGIISSAGVNGTEKRARKTAEEVASGAKGKLE